MKLILYWIPALAYNGLIFYLSSLPQSSLVTTIPDEISHFLEFGFLALLILFGLTKGFSSKISKKNLFLTISLSFIIAISDEFHQSFTLSRTVSLKDILFDLVGSVSFSLIIFWLKIDLAKYLRKI